MFSFYSVAFPPKKKVVLLLLDYDGVVSYLHEAMDRLAHAKPGHEHHEYLQKSVSATRHALHQLLDAQTLGADVVELGVGSSRQCRSLDRSASQYNRHNGLCFEVLADLAKAKGWIFNRSLLGDYENKGVPRSKPLPPGSTMGPLVMDRQGHYRYAPDDVSDAINTYPDDLKVRVMNYHMHDVLSRYDDSRCEIKLVLVDDQRTILEANGELLEKTNKLPPHLSINLIQFNCCALFKKNQFDASIGQLELNKKAQNEVSVYKRFVGMNESNSMMITHNIRQGYDYLRVLSACLDCSGMRLVGFSISALLFSLFLLPKSALHQITDGYGAKRMT